MQTFSVVEAELFVSCNAGCNSEVRFFFQKTLFIVYGKTETKNYGAHYICVGSLGYQRICSELRSYEIFGFIVNSIQTFPENTHLPHCCREKNKPVHTQ